jgi:predicted GNAT family N-acyltransferase
MNTLEIQYGSAAYRECLALRNAVLRAPLGMELSEEDVAGEHEHLHVGIFQGQQLMGCIIAKPIEAGRLAKIRQMVIASEAQGKGFGHRLLRDTESLLKARGFSEVELNARKTAIPFYEKQGYKGVGDFFDRLGLPHLKMQKTL